MGRPSVWQLLILLLIIILLFGARRLPELARSVGESLKIFKSSIKDDDARESGSDAPRDDAPRGDAPRSGDTTPPSETPPPRRPDGGPNI